MMLHNEDAAYPTEADAEILGSGKSFSPPILGGGGGFLTISKKNPF